MSTTAIIGVGILCFFIAIIAFGIGNKNGRQGNPKFNLFDGVYFKLLKVIPEQKLFIFEAVNNGKKINYPFVIQDGDPHSSLLRFDKIEEGAVYQRANNTLLFIDMRIFTPNEKLKTVEETT